MLIIICKISVYLKISNVLISKNYNKISQVVKFYYILLHQNYILLKLNGQQIRIRTVQ